MARTPPLPYANPEGHGAKNRGESLVIIANPRAGGGRAGADRGAILRAAERAFEQVQLVWTEAPGHATTLAREWAPKADIIAALGGDGTCHEVVNGLLDGDEPVSRKTIFTVLPFGTGGDLVRSLEIKGGLEGALWIAATGMTLRLDAGRLDWPDGRTEAFVNVAGFGANAEVCVRANASSKRFGGGVTFVGAILETLRSYEPLRARWRWDGPDGPGEVEMETLASFCANGHYCGAGLWVGRGGSMADGVFELTLIPRLSFARSVRHLPKVYRGRMEAVDGVVRVRVTTVEVQSTLPIELDGEPRGPGPVRVRVLPQVLQVRGGWLRPPTAEVG